MTLFYQLLVAPVALGFLVPLAANAAEVKLNDVAGYAKKSAKQVQVKSVQFSDVVPGDWAYTALQSLSERYSCIDNVYTQNLNSGQALTRYEAAALVNACLEGAAVDVSAYIARLSNEFGTEMAILKGRVDGLDENTSEFNAGQVSSVTKFSGEANFVVGRNRWSGSRVENPPSGYNERLGKVTFNYDYQLAVDTSFTGHDRLRTVLRSGNFGTTNNAFSGLGNGTGSNDEDIPMNALDVAFNSESIVVDRLFYQFPLNDQIIVKAGPLIRQDDTLAMRASAYSEGKILDVFTSAGSPATYNNNQGVGLGLMWEKGYFNMSASHIAAKGDDATVGFFADEESDGTTTIQLGYRPENWGIALGYSYSDGDVPIPAGTDEIHDETGSDSEHYQSFALSSFWIPEATGWPSVSAGVGYSLVTDEDGSDFERNYALSWILGLQWNDIFAEGNAAGIAAGQPPFETSETVKDDPDLSDHNYAFETWYKFQLTDRLSCTPALFYFVRQTGSDGADDLEYGDGTFNNFGGLIKTTFTF